MAAKRSAIILAAVALVALLPAALSQAMDASTLPAPNVTAVLEKGGLYTNFARLMKSTKQDTELNSQFNNSGAGFTVFAPTDNAFDNLKPGTLDSLTPKQLVAFVRAHILPIFFSMDSFGNASNPVHTQASSADGPYLVNITANSNRQVNVSTGLVTTTIGPPLRAIKPLAVYSVDKVLLPYDLFGPKPPASSPPASSPPASSPSSLGAKGVSEAARDAAAVGAGWSFAAVVAAAAACLL